jgi:hypothetical protein
MGGQWRRVLVALVILAGATPLACGQTRKNPDGGHPAPQPGEAGSGSGAGGTAPIMDQYAADCAQVLSGQRYGYCAVYQNGSVWCFFIMRVDLESVRGSEGWNLSPPSSPTFLHRQFHDAHCR